MSVLISILIFAVCILLILIILVQNPKGGLASNFTSSNQVMGVQRTGDFLEKATWSLAIGLVILSIATAAFNREERVVEQEQSEIQEQVEDMSLPIQNNVSIPAEEEEEYLEEE